MERFPPELTALLLHLLAQQGPPHTDSLLQLPPLPSSLAVSGHPGLALKYFQIVKIFFIKTEIFSHLIGGQDLQLPVEPVGQLVGLALLGLVQTDLEGTMNPR